MNGFFPQSATESKAPPSRHAKCGACGLFKTCNSPKMPVTGKGRRGILIVAEAPGKTEDERGVQLIGDSGQLLRKSLRSLGIDLDKDCWKTNAVICRPPKNETPSDKRMEYCRPNLLQTIEEKQPHAIILLGMLAVKSLIGTEWKRDIGSLSQWVGWNIPSQRYNAWICPTFHPAYLLRSKNEPVLQLMFDRHLESAVEHEERPWKRVPDFQSKVNVIIDPKEAAKQIRVNMAFNPRMVAFDYETNMLKPDSHEANIVSCSVCFDGKTSIAFPWHGRAVEAMEELLRSDIPKVAANMKFEDRWTRAKLGFPVRRWLFDTMLAAHVLDNRKGICSLKFQSYVHFGQPDYDSHIAPYLRGKGSNAKNRIREVELDKLLLYNGMDSLLEYKLAVEQMAALKYTPQEPVRTKR